MFLTKLITTILLTVFIIQPVHTTWTHGWVLHEDSNGHWDCTKQGNRKC